MILTDVQKYDEELERVTTGNEIDLQEIERMCREAKFIKMQTEKPQTWTQSCVCTNTQGGKEAGPEWEERERGEGHLIMEGRTIVSRDLNKKIGTSLFTVGPACLPHPREAPSARPPHSLPHDSCPLLSLELWSSGSMRTLAEHLRKIFRG